MFKLVIFTVLFVNLAKTHPQLPANQPLVVGLTTRNRPLAGGPVYGGAGLEHLGGDLIDLGDSLEPLGGDGEYIGGGLGLHAAGMGLTEELGHIDKSILPIAEFIGEASTFTGNMESTGGLLGVSEGKLKHIGGALRHMYPEYVLLYLPYEQRPRENGFGGVGGRSIGDSSLVLKHKKKNLLEF